MRHSKRWVSASALTATLIVVWGLVLGSVALAQEARWETVNQKALQLLRQGKYQEGIRVAKEGLRVAEKTFGSDHPNVATSLNNLAGLYHAQGKYAEAEVPLVMAQAFREGKLEVMDYYP